MGLTSGERERRLNAGCASRCDLEIPEPIDCNNVSEAITATSFEQELIEVANLELWMVERIELPTQSSEHSVLRKTSVLPPVG